MTAKEKDLMWLGTSHEFMNFQDIVLGFRVPFIPEPENTPEDRYNFILQKLDELYGEVIENILSVLDTTDEVAMALDSLVQSQLANPNAQFDVEDSWGDYGLETYANIVRILYMAWQYCEFNVVYFVQFQLTPGMIAKNIDKESIVPFVPNLVWGQYEPDLSINAPIFLMGYYELLSGDKQNIPNMRGYIQIAGDCRAKTFHEALLDCKEALPKEVTLRVYSHNMTNLVTQDYTNYMIVEALE